MEGRFVTSGLRPVCPITPHPRIKYGAGSNLPPSRRHLRNPSINPTSAPTTLTLILSQDGRGDKRGGDGGYAKVSRMGEEVRGGRDGLPPSREQEMAFNAKVFHHIKKGGRGLGLMGLLYW